MNILYTITSYPPSIGGAQLHTHLIAKNLSERNHVEVVTLWDRNRNDWLIGTTLGADQDSRDYAIENISVHRIGLSSGEKKRLFPYVLIYYPFMHLALPKIAACIESHISPYAEHADIIHNIRIGREPISYASYHVAKNRQIPFVLTPVHHQRWRGWRYRKYIELYKMADLVIALTDIEKYTLSDLGVDEERIYVTGHGPVLASEADPKRFIERHSIHGPFVLFLGQHYPYKGYLQLLQAAKLIWSKLPDIDFVFIGPPIGRSEKEFASFADNRIHRLGKVDLQEKTDALAACTLLCVPSLQESFGGIYTEAWSFGKPVIGGNIPAIAEVVSNGVDGYLTQQNPKEIAERIYHLLANETVAKRMGAAGKAKVREKYSWERIAELTEQAYRKVLAI